MHSTRSSQAADGGRMRFNGGFFASAGQRQAAAVEPSEPPLNPGDEAEPGTPGTGENVCPRCNGSGRDGATDCPECGGSGKVTTAIGGG